VKPIKLVIEGFGSFPGREEIDFAALAPRGLFVVTGPTGTGKTTIFDAMVFALYGVLPGTGPGSRQASDVRSHHAGPETKTEVTFDFDIDGTRYRVTRNPEYERPKLRGSGTTSEAASATLAKLDEASTVVATGARPCQKACEELIGIGAEQFQRVVLLPQGEFDRFLTATEDEREKLLRRLFGGEVFERLVKRLKERSDRLAAGVGESEQRLAEALRNAGSAADQARRVLVGADVPSGEAEGTQDGEPAAESDGEAEVVRSAEEIRTALDAIAGDHKKLAQQSEVARKTADTAAEKANRAKDEAGRFDRAVELRGELTGLESQREAIEADEALIVQSQAARPVAAAADEADASEHAAAKAVADLGPVRDEVATVLVELACPSAGVADPAPAAVAEEIATARADNKGHVDLLDAATAAAAKVAATEAEYETSALARDGAGAERDAAEAAVTAAAAAVEAARPAAGKAEAARGALAEAEQRRDDRTVLDGLRSGLGDLEAVKAAAHDAYVATMAAYVASEAPRLAEGLVSGEPCAVCGSTDHPRPASPGEGAPLVRHEEVEKAGKRRSEADDGVTARGAEIRAKAEALGSAADSSVEELDAGVQAARDAVSAADAADAAFAAAEAAAAEADRQRSLAVEALGGVEQALSALAGRLESERKASDSTQAAIAGLDPDRIRRVGATLDRIGDLVGRYQGAVDAVAAAETKRSAAVARLNEVLGTSPFVDIEAARAELLDRSREEELEAQVKTWRDGLRTLNAQLAELAGLGVPEVRPDAEALNDAAEAARTEATALTDRVSQVGVHLGYGRTALADAEREETGSVDTRAEAETARQVYATCAGRGGRLKTPLDRWVLAGELELVADAANGHLSRLTAHRYQLRRDAEKELGLVIFDGHSGRERPTGSLSGGEKFQVSLALALGLADVVSRGGKASGRVYEALFVDEGFGSLDPEALDQAVGALLSLQAGGRVVGAITHVEAMKQQLHVGIEVRRRSEGSGSTLVVYP